MMRGVDQILEEIEKPPGAALGIKDLCGNVIQTSVTLGNPGVQPDPCASSGLLALLNWA